MYKRQAVGRAVVSRDGRENRVEVEVDGAPIWFASADAELCPSPEAFGSALLIPALHAGRRLSLAEPVDALWRRNALGAARTVAEWWDYRPSPPRARRSWRRRERARGTALCFSGGADSFYSLLRGRWRPDLLCLVHGYDIELGDVARLEGAERTLRAVARATGTRAVLVRSNLREHPTFAAVSWERSHGGALAAVGHLLTGHCGDFLISATLPRPEARPWGSHWRVDPLWSSTKLRVQHVGDELGRDEKLRELASDELVRRHLRVCWENRSSSLNCCRCDKCLVTMVALKACGQLDHCQTFSGGAQLIERLDALPATRYLNGYGRLLNADLEADLHDTVARLVARTRATVGQMQA